tara:strand:+ start:538 stop:771 length:234 start_codon:yes stop_codon:yes gene_type:complete
MSWSSITAKNCPAKPPTPTQPIKKVIQEEVKNDYWNDPKYDCNWKTVEQQIIKSYKKLGLEPPKTIYGRPSTNDFGK